MTGTIAHIVRDRGFGLIRPDADAGDLIFFYRTDVIGGVPTFKSMNQGDAVTFETNVATVYGPAARITEWRPEGTIARMLLDAADAIDDALARMNMVHMIDGNTRRFENFQHAKVHQHLSGMPDKLRREAAALTTKETLVQRDTGAGQAQENFAHGRIADIID